jgi:hypothetical protein
MAGVWKYGGSSASKHATISGRAPGTARHRFATSSAIATAAALSSAPGVAGTVS